MKKITDSISGMGRVMKSWYLIDAAINLISDVVIRGHYVTNKLTFGMFSNVPLATFYKDTRKLVRFHPV